MKRGVLIICDREEVYARRLMDYLNRKERFFEICIFTAVQALLDYLRSHRVDILLMEEELWEERIAEQMAGKIILLSENGQRKGELPYPVVCKLQPAENIEKEIMGCYAQGGERTLPELAISAVERKKQLWGVFSPVGGSGTTTFALALGQRLAREGSVLYLNLENFGSLVGEGAYKGGMTDLLYYIKERKENLFLLLASLAEKRQELDCILSVDYYGDLLSIREEDVDYLLGELEKSRYETILLDVGCATPAFFYLLSKCSRIFLPQRKEEQQGKMAAMERSLRMEGREELLLRMEKLLVPNAQGPEMERFLWKIAQDA